MPALPFSSLINKTVVYYCFIISVVYRNGDVLLKKFGDLFLF